MTRDRLVTGLVGGVLGGCVGALVVVAGRELGSRTEPVPVPASAGVMGISASGRIVGQSIQLLDRSGAERVQIYCNNDGSPSLRLLDQDGRPRIAVSANSDGFTGFSVLSPGGETRCTMNVSPDGFAVISVSGDGRTPFAYLEASADCATIATGVHKDGTMKRQAMLESDRFGNGRGAIRDMSGTDWKVPSE
jgi:hypothetical protein